MKRELGIYTLLIVCVHCCRHFQEKNFYETKVQTLDDKWRDKLELELLIPVNNMS